MVRFVSKGGRVISTGTNRIRNWGNHIPADAISYHAEEVALRRAGKAAKGATLYVARMGRDGNPAISKPCKKCSRLISEAGIKQVVYTVGA